MLNTTRDSIGQDENEGVTTTSEWQRSSLPAQNCRGIYVYPGLNDGSIHQAGPSDAKVRFDSSQARLDANVSYICLRTITAKIMNNRKVSSMDRT